MQVPSFVEGNLITLVDQAERGIGVVRSVDGDLVHVQFHTASAETEIYLASMLQRHRYVPGDIVFSRLENAYGIVHSVRENSALFMYQVLIGPRRKGIPEVDILPVPPARDPFDLLRSSELGDVDTFVLTLQARRLHYAYSYEELVSLSNARIELLPHQVFVAHRILGEYPHRFLLADEVGLGKTIEAGLILKELRARGAARRVLIITPAGLVPQWVTELARKFNEPFTRLDAITFRAYAAIHGEQGVWKAFDNIITSLHFLRSHEEYVDALAEQEWDLIIFDEAHHLRRYLDRGSAGKRTVTDAYRLAQRLQAQTTALLLLTATPLQLHSYELFSLIELLDPTLFPSFQDFEQYRRQIPELNGIARRLAAYETLDGPNRLRMAEDLARVLTHAHPGQPVLGAAIKLTMDKDPTGREQLQEKLGHIHRLTAVMLRNRKRQVFDDVQPRRARLLRVKFSGAERAAYDAVTAYLEQAYNLAIASNNQALGFLMVTYRKLLTSSSEALHRSLSNRIVRLLELKKAHQLLQQRKTGDLLAPDEEEELDRALQRYADAVLDFTPAGLDAEMHQLQLLCSLLEVIEIDSKALRLGQELKQILANSQEKVLIFTQFKRTLESLQDLLGPHYRIVIFHGEMDATEKDLVVDEFRDPAGAQIMIATEAAGEGRNLQFCHIMFNYDLPWNPMKIEQRIGRLDRIGQQHPVEIYNFTVENTVEDRVLQVLHERIQIFETTIGQLDPILGDLERDVRELLLRPGGAAESDVLAFEDRVAARLEEARQMEAQLADFILDSRSFRRDRTNELLGRKPAFTGEDIQRFLARFLHYTGGQVRESSPGIFELQVPRSLRGSGKRELKDSYQVTFDARIAQQHDRLDFVAFGHDLLDQAVEACLVDDFGGRTAYLRAVGDGTQTQRGIAAVYELVFDGIRRRKQLLILAVDLAGNSAPALADTLPDLILRTTEVATDNATLQPFLDVLEPCVESLEMLRDRYLEEERQRCNVQNTQDYAQEREKLSRFYAARLASAQHEVDRLQTQMHDQEQSADPAMRRISPATRGRFAVAVQSSQDIIHQRDDRLEKLDQQRSISYSYQLVSTVLLTIDPSPGGTPQ